MKTKILSKFYHKTQNLSSSVNILYILWIHKSVVTPHVEQIEEQIQFVVSLTLRYFILRYYTCSYISALSSFVTSVYIQQIMWCGVYNCMCIVHRGMLLLEFYQMLFIPQFCGIHIAALSIFFFFHFYFARRKKNGK